MNAAAEMRASENGLSVCFSGGASTGIARAAIEEEMDAHSRILSWIHALQNDMKIINIKTVVEFAPKSLRDYISVWGESTGEQFIMRGIKQKIDPNNILNPGRYVGGI